MPRTILRLLAVALLSLAVPVQGMASVVAGQCMAFGHHQDGGSQDHGHAQDGADGHDHAGHSHSDDGGAKQSDDPGKTAHCGPCAACCASASIAGAVGLSIPSSATHAEYAFTQLPPPGVQPGGFDRPPLAL
jgi:hypothetical protein